MPLPARRQVHLFEELLALTSNCESCGHDDVIVNLVAAPAFFVMITTSIFAEAVSVSV
jgi:uncharacterized protein (DUF983 family)